jgi:hypothetical protein
MGLRPDVPLVIYKTLFKLIGKIDTKEALIGFIFPHDIRDTIRKVLDTSAGAPDGRSGIKQPRTLELITLHRNLICLTMISAVHIEVEIIPVFAE